MIIPNTDINLATEVRDVLSNAGGVVDNNLLSFFTVDAKLNKWSKHKPVKYHSDFPLTEEEYDKLYGDKLYWWKAYNGFCGFLWESIEFNSISSLLDAYKNNEIFQYELPTGGQEWPYRLGDFRNYDSEAKSPIRSFEASGEMIMDSNGYSDQNDSSITFTIRGNSNIDTRYNLTMADIAFDGTDFTLADLFFGVIIMGEDGYFIKRNTEFIGDNQGWTKSVTITLGDMADHKMANFYQHVAYPVIMNAEENLFYPCDIPAIPFVIKVDPAEAKVGWMEGEPHYCRIMDNTALRFYGTLAWNDDYENTQFTFEAYIIRKNGTKDTVRVITTYPSKDYAKPNSDNEYYMYIGDDPYLVLDGRKNIEDGDTYVLSVSYPNSTGTMISRTMQWKDEPISSGPEDV